MAGEFKAYEKRVEEREDFIRLAHEAYDDLKEYFMKDAPMIYKKPKAIKLLAELIEKLGSPYDAY